MSNHLKIIFMLVLGISINACQTKTYFEDVSFDKKTVVERNIVLFTSEVPSKLRISYYETVNGIDNVLVTKTIQTPYALDMNNAVIKYDSLNFYRSPKKTLIKGVRKFKHNFDEGGAEYLKIENLSNQEIKYALVGTEKLQTQKNIDANKEVIISHPKPLYKGIPLLYLLKPELAPNKDLYFEAIEDYEKTGGKISVGKTSLRKIALYENRLGEVKDSELPFSIDKILSIYENESEKLFLGYSDYSLELLGVKNANEKYRNLVQDKKNWSILAPNAKFMNNGKIHILSITFDEDYNLN